MLKLFLFIVLIINCLVKCEKDEKSMENSLTKIQNTFVVKISTPLLKDLQEFQHLIPNQQLRNLLAKYYYTNLEFQKTMRFIRSKKFDQLLMLLVIHPSICIIFEYLGFLVQESADSICPTIADKAKLILSTDNDYPFAREYNLMGKFDEAAILVNETTLGMKFPDDILTSKSKAFSQFLEKLTRKLNKQDFSDFLSSKVLQSSVWRKFYRNLRSMKMFHMIEKALVGKISSFSLSLSLFLSLSIYIYI